MSTLTPQQIANYAKVAGFTANGLVLAIAVALAESGGDTAARGYNRDRNGTITSVDRGLWQINSAAHSEVSDNCAFDPTCCAQAAFRISSHGEDWSPWTTYVTGAYKQYMATALQASGTGQQSSAPPPTPSTNNTSGGTGVGAMLEGFTPVSMDNVLKVDYVPEGTGNNNAAYRTVLAWGVLLAFVFLIARTRVGYVAVYYSEVLILLFLFATQARFFAYALQPLTSFNNPQGQ